MTADATEYERATAPVVADVRDHVLRLETKLKAGAPGPEALYIAGLLSGLRKTLAAVECNLEALAAARVLGRDEAWAHGFRRGHAAGLQEKDSAGRRQVISLLAPRAVTAEAG